MQARDDFERRRRAREARHQDEVGSRGGRPRREEVRDHEGRRRANSRSREEWGEREHGNSHRVEQGPATSYSMHDFPPIRRPGNGRRGAHLPPRAWAEEDGERKEDEEGGVTSSDFQEDGEWKEGGVISSDFQEEGE